MPQRDWRADPGDAARTLLTVVNDPSSFMRGDDGHVTQRWTPGSFVRSLTECMLRADRQNLALLAIGFPAWGRAVDHYREHPQGVQGLREQAGWTTGGIEPLGPPKSAGGPE